MFRKLHIQLTALCTACTAVIVIVITILCLYTSERGMKEKEYGVFLTNVNAFYTHIQYEEKISMEWYQKSRMNGRYIISVEDNGEQLSLVSLIMSDEEQVLIEQAGKIAKENYNLDISSSRTARAVHKQADFSFKDDQNQEYYAALFYIPRDNGFMSMSCIYPLSSFKSELLRQRLIFGGFILLAIFSLGVFSYFFTDKVLKPIEKNREKQVAFISAASHEMRSPLTVIKASLAAQKKADEEKTARFDEIVQMELSRMERLVNDMLALSRADASSWGINYEKVDLRELISAAVEKFSELANKKGIKISFLYAPDLALMCWCDRQRMEQVITILIDNGVSYIPEGGQVTIRVEKKKKRWLIRVSDNGEGVADDQKVKIFERFYRGDHSHNSKEHFGLGLPIAREIMRLHRGGIHAEDSLEGGACFVCWLPDSYGKISGNI